MTCTLADIERATALRVGPFYIATADRQQPSTASFESVIVPSLRSTVEQDLVTNLWLLRRGVDVDGNSVSVSPLDRQRQVATYEPERGQVIVDRPWSVIPSASEILEFHHLNPEVELRTVVRAGLRRCFMTERYSLGNGYIYEADLTASLPWLDDPDAVQTLEMSPYPTGYYGNTRHVPFVAFMQSGNVCIRVNAGCSGPFYGGLLITLLRSHFTFVNGLDTTVGPTSDADTLAVDLDYAAAAGHIEAWHSFPAKLQSAAAGGTQATQQMAALEFTRQALIHGPRQMRHWGFSEVFGGSGYLPLVVNA